MADSGELRYGIQTGGGIQTVGQWFAVAAGAAYVTIGVIGFFITGFNGFTEVTGETLLGIFAINPFHNVVHIGTGALFLTAALLLGPAATGGALFGIGGFYVVAAILGYLGYLNLVGINAALDPVNFFHLISGVLAVVFSAFTSEPAGSSRGGRTMAGAR